MKNETSLEFWTRVLATPAARAVYAKQFEEKRMLAQARESRLAREAADAKARSLIHANAASEKSESKPLFGLARTAAAWNAQLCNSAPRLSTESIWAKQLQAKEVTGLARTIAAMKAKRAA